MSKTNDKFEPDIIDQGDGVFAIDTGYLRPRMDASHLIVAQGRGAFVDTGTAYSVPALLAALKELALDVADIDYVLLTHIHLDHAGGAGQLMAALPNATLVVHPRGARHMANPEKLIAGSIKVYGEELYRELYGELLPIAEERIHVIEDAEKLRLADRELKFLHTPGHALHHYSIVDRESDGIFTGDSFGISYREFDTAAGAFIMPTTTPVHFDPEAAHETIDRLLSYKTRRMFLTHYSAVSPPDKLARDLHQDLDAFVQFAHRHAASDDRHGDIVGDMYDYLDKRLDRHGCALEQKERHRLLEPDVELNTQGLEFWMDRHMR
jgi:glyoxylase-like metal-dependent hydrolase (beta-lactamase superfamily II)